MASLRHLLVVLLSIFVPLAWGRAAPPTTDAGFMALKQWWWNDPDGLYLRGLHNAAPKVQALKAEFGMDDRQLLQYVAQAQRHARHYRWVEGGMLYSFCRYYQNDLKQVVDHLRSIVKALDVHEKARAQAEQERTAKAEAASRAAAFDRIDALAEARAKARLEEEGAAEAEPQAPPGQRSVAWGEEEDAAHRNETQSGVGPDCPLAVLEGQCPVVFTYRQGAL